MCKVIGCDRKSMGQKEYCRPHYERLIRWGDPLGKRRIKGEAKAYVDAILETGNWGDECLVWPYPRRPDGYAEFNHEKVKYPLHQYACEYVNGPKSEENPVCRHLCGNGHLGCFNPNHLVWGTYQENTLDAVKHKTHIKGEVHQKVNLKEADILEIYRRAHSGEDQRDIAASFGITQPTVSAIKLGRTWSWLTGAEKKDGYNYYIPVSKRLS